MAVVTLSGKRTANRIRPGDLRIVVGMGIDKSRCDDLACGIDFLVALWHILTNFRDLTAVDSQVRLEWFPAQAVKIVRRELQHRPSFNLPHSHNRG